MEAIGSARLRQALRTLGQAKAFVFMVVALIAIGVGANAAVVRFASRLLWEWPSGIAHPEAVKRLYVVTRWSVAHVPIIRPEMSYAWYQAIKGSREVGTAAGYTRPDSLVVENRAGSRMVLGSYATSSYWSLLGIHAAQGRLFDSTDDRLGDGAPVVVVSHASAISWFGGTDGVIGRALRVNGRMFTVVGITAPEFYGTDLTQTALWLPLATYPGGSIGDTPWYDSWDAGGILRVLFREPNVPDGALAGPTGLIRQGELVHRPLDPDTTATILSGSLRETLGPSLTVRPEVLISNRLLLVSVGLLFVVFLNVGTLGLVRASRRRREQAVKIALGASRGRFVADVLLENLIIGVMGATAALPAALACEGLLRATVPRVTDWAPDSVKWVLPATALAGGLAAVVALCLPQLVRGFRVFRTNVFDVSSSHETHAPGTWELGTVALQVAVAVALVGGAGLFVQNIRSLRAIDVGYDVDDLVLGSGTFFAPTGAVPGDVRERNADRLAAALNAIQANPRAIVGSEGSALASTAPLHGYAMAEFYRKDRTPLPKVANREAAIYAVSPDFFRVVGLHVTRGRVFDGDDERAGVPVIVVNETAARAYWGSVDPVGQCVVPAVPQEPCATVIGVVHDTHLLGLMEGPRAAAFVPFGGGFFTFLHRPHYLVVRTRPEARPAVARQLEHLLRDELGPDAIPQVSTMASFIAPELRPWDLGAMLFSVFGFFAVLIAAAGAYGVMSSIVEARRRELAVRNALGGTWGQIGTWLAVTRGSALVIGLALGAALALGLAATLRSRLTGVGYLGSESLIGALAIVGIVGAFAIAVPILAAARMNTVELLRRD